MDPPHTKLKVVDKLSITFLADNNIEWMTKLPPGFTHELQQHIDHECGTQDHEKNVRVVDFNKFCCGTHGFAALIETHVRGETNSRLTLFDTGPDKQSLVRNMAAMQVPIKRIERVIISHWHSDHTGGLLSFLSLRNKTTPACTVDVHPDRPILRGSRPVGKVIYALPADPTFKEIEGLQGVLDEQREGHTVAGGAVWVSGEIPRRTAIEKGIKGGVRWVGETYGWIKDELIMDERYAAIDVAGKGLVIFSACSHAGIMNVVMDAIKTFSRPIYMIVGGLHLAGPDYSAIIPPTVEFLTKKLNPVPEYILPMHCSGFKAKIALEKALGDRCVPTGVGHRVDLEGDWEIDDSLLPATYENA